jgi:hypothetical protein
MIQSSNTHSELSSPTQSDESRHSSKRATADMPTLPPRKYLTTKEAMAYLNIRGRTKFWRYRKKYPQLLPMAEGWFRISDLDAFIEHLFSINKKI